MPGFRSLGANEELEFYCKISEKGFEATKVCGPSNSECHGSDFRPHPKKKFRKVRCYNCGEFANHIASKCSLGPMPKRCHHCKKDDHLIADCPEKPVSRMDKIFEIYSRLFIWQLCIFMSFKALRKRLPN